MTAMQVERKVESELVKVDSLPGSVWYNVEVTLPDGSVKTVKAKAYTRSLLVLPDGKVEISIAAKDERIIPHTIRYPYHQLVDGVLCAIKFNKMEVTSSFTLNYNLFCEKWDTCLMFHVGNGAAVFVSGRKEWEEKGVVGSNGEEVNISLDVESARHVPVEIIRPTLGPKVLKWLEDAMRLAECRGKL